MTQPFVPPARAYADIGLTVLRVVTGLIFMMHGWQKLFVFGVSGVSEAFARMGAPFPSVTGPLFGVIEIVGGIALIIGLFTRWAAIATAIDVLGALFVVHIKNGFFVPMGVEFVLLLFAASVALALVGPGAYSADEAIAARRMGSRL